MPGPFTCSNFMLSRMPHAPMLKQGRITDCSLRFLGARFLYKRAGALQTLTRQFPSDSHPATQHICRPSHGFSFKRLSQTFRVKDLSFVRYFMLAFLLS